MAYKIFISHVWRAQNDFYRGLLRLLEGAKRFDFNDLSVPKIRRLDGDYAQAREEILSSLRTADVVLVVNTPVVSNSRAVQDELLEAEKIGIPVVAVLPPRRLGMTRRSNFEAVQRAYPAEWTTRSIVSAIRMAVRQKPRQRADSEETTSAVTAYEPIADAAAAAPLTPAEAAEVLEDEPLAAGAAVGQNATPKDVIFAPKDEPPRLVPKRSWLARWLFR